MMKLIKNVKIVFKDNISEGAVLFSDIIEDIILEDIGNYIEGIRDCLRNNSLNNSSNYNSSTKEKSENGDLESLEIVDGKGYYLAPGFIDIHIHGSAGYDTMDSNLEALKEIGKSLVRSGVTSFLPTTMSMPRKSIDSALRNIQQLVESRDEGLNGARILGCHLEGPFLNQDYKGAQSSKDIIKADNKLIEEYLDIIKIVTIAPEIEGAESFIKFLADNNIVVSAGHSGASYQKIITAIDWGLSHVTHLFNAMSKFHHREPGIIGAALTTDLTCELIADFVHVHPAAIKMVLQAKKLEHIILVTDQMRAGSMGEGEYDLGGQKVFVKDGSARLENGQLAGSILTLDQAVRNIKSVTDEVIDIPLYKIINMATYNPAKCLGMENEIGHIEKGKRADFVLLNDRIEVTEVFKDGQNVPTGNMN
ncbi:MAG: N-acetylglucosamine-6-phosphate deacetylase [Halanaerobiales bacterium]